MSNVDNCSLRFWSPELRRAIMKIRPDYFTWPVEQQERYRIKIPKLDEALLEEVLLAELFGRRYLTRDEVIDAIRHLTLAEQNRLNEVVLPLNGIGEDCFYLNETFGKNKTILDFDSLRVFDEDDYRFQEESRKEDDPTYVGKPYRGSLYFDWARLYVDGRFTYATLSMASGYIYAQISNTAHESMEKRIPYRHVPGKHHGKGKGNQRQWDLRVNADGQEGVLEELQQRIGRYEQERYDALLSFWDKASQVGVYLLDHSEVPEANLHFVFTDKQALAAVKFRSFLRDCRAMERSESELSRAVNEEKIALARFIKEQHAEVVRTYDPKVRKFRKRRKMMVMKDLYDEFG